MRRQLATLAMGTWVALAGLVVTAAPAAAHPAGDCVSTERRNVGGTGPAGCSCWVPPGLGERRNVGGTGPVSCGCGPLERRNVGGTGPVACACPPALGPGERRNVGGTGPAGCLPAYSAWWQFPRFR